MAKLDPVDNPKLSFVTRYVYARTKIERSALSSHEKNRLCKTVGAGLGGELHSPVVFGAGCFWVFPDGTKAAMREKDRTPARPRNQMALAFANAHAA